MDTNIAFNILKFSPNPRSHEDVCVAFQEAIQHIEERYEYVESDKFKKRLNWLALYGRWTEYLYVTKEHMHAFGLLFISPIADAVSICLRFGMRKLACKIIDLYTQYAEEYGEKKSWDRLVYYLSQELELLVSWLMKKADKYRLLKKLIKSDISDFFFVGYLTREMVNWLLQLKWMDFRRNQLLVWHEVSYGNRVFYVDLYSSMTIYDYLPELDVSKRYHAPNTSDMQDIVTHSYMYWEIWNKDSDQLYTADELFECIYSRMNFIGTLAAQTISERLTSLSLSAHHKICMLDYIHR